MSFVELLKQPWFAVSPSPWSIGFYALFGLIGARILLNMWPSLYGSSRRKWISGFLDALFLLWMIVMIQDSIWLIFNTAKWILPLYSDVATFWNYYVRFAQNGLGFLLFTLLTYGKFQLRVVTFNRKTLGILALIAAFTGAVFFLAPSQAYTDWTFAVSRGFSDQIILESFLISHVGYKALIAAAFLCLFNRQKLKSNIRRLGS